MTASILIIDDEPAIRRLVRGALERAGQRADEAADAREGLALARQPGRELVLLDLGLPDRDGLELIPLLKAAGLAVVALTARSDTEEKVAALDLGADDYVTKPFDTVELLARVRVALRHRGGVSGGTAQMFGAIAFDPGARRLTRHGEPVRLTPKEYALFAELARHAGRVLTHAHLLRAAWGEAHLDDVEYLRVAMRSLRAKLEDDPGHPRLLVTDPGIGYRLAAD